MPQSSYFGEELKKAIKDGKVPESRLNDMVQRMLWAMISVGVLDWVDEQGNLHKNATRSGRQGDRRCVCVMHIILLRISMPVVPSARSTTLWLISWRRRARCCSRTRVSCCPYPPSECLPGCNHIQSRNPMIGDRPLGCICVSYVLCQHQEHRGFRR
jgi:hypothetical protein